MASLAAGRLVLSLLLLVATSRANLIRGGGGNVLEAEQKEFDHFTLALYWPATLCKSVEYCTSTEKGCCRSEPVTGFTLHGFWPDYDDGTWPTCCNGPEYDQNKISNLMDDLNNYWPPYYNASIPCGKRIKSIWAYQWVTYGTCASPILNNPYEYFSAALMLYFKYNVTAVLVGSGYVPSDSNKYPLEGITSAIQNAFKITPLVTCYGDALRDVQICFDKKLKPQDCPTESSTESGILSKESLECPSYVSLPIMKKIKVLETMKLPFYGTFGKSPISLY